VLYFTVSKTFQELPSLVVSVDHVTFDASRPAPPDRPYPFVYQISILNSSPHTVNIFKRKWIVKDTEGDTLVVEGDGIVGQFPNLSPGQSFTYNSYHVIKAHSTASGSFFGTTAEGTPIAARIPPFTMTPPPIVV
jgi:ApaG protein